MKLNEKRLLAAFMAGVKDRREGFGYRPEHDRVNDDEWIIAYTNGRLAEAHYPGKGGLLRWVGASWDEVITTRAGWTEEAYEIAMRRLKYDREARD